MDHNSVEISVPPDNPGYIMSLDNFDMSYLYNYDRSREVPIWSPRGSDFMEFQVFSQEIPTNPDEEKLENASSRRCHICEVDVPVAYFATHKGSSKHQMYSSIARTGLERIKKQMDVELASVDSLAPLAPQPSTYYCESCSQAINRSDLESHNSSNQHTICKKRDKYMDYLIQIYENPSNFEDFVSTFEEFKITPQPKDVVVKPEPKLSWKQEVLRFIESVNRATVHKIQYIDDNTIEIRTKSGSKLAVAFDNFHGFCEDNGAVLCRVCRSLIGDKYKHINDDGHITKLKAAIEDKHCVRKLDQILNHCILCNEIIENSEVHISTEKHQTALKNSLKDESGEINKILAGNMMIISNFSKYVYFCNLCKMYVEHNGLEQHVALDFHVELLARTPRYNPNKKINKKQGNNEPQNCITCKVVVQGGKKGMRAHRTTPDHKYLGWLTTKDQKIHHHLSKISLVNNATCKVCKIIISADKSAMDQHIAGVEHQSNFQGLLKENKMAIVNEKYISCNACDIKVLTFDELKHMVKKNHKKNVTKTLKYPDEEKVIQHYFVINRDEYYCEICGVTIEQKDFDFHMNCEWHLKNVSKQKINELDTKIENKATFFQETEPQQDQIVSDKTQIDEPMDALTNSRQKQQMAVFDGNHCTVCKMTVNGDETKKMKHIYFSDHRNIAYLNDLASGTRLHHHIKVIEGKITCKVCKTGIEVNSTSVQNHINSHEHHSQYRALSRNLLTQTTKARVICTLCVSSILILDEISHLISKGHMRKLREHGFDLNPVNSGTGNSLSNISENNELIKCGPEYFCGVCFISEMHGINLNENPPANTDVLNALREESMEDQKLLNATDVCKDPAIGIGVDDLNYESDDSFTSAKTSLTGSKSLSYTEITSENEIQAKDVTSYMTSEFAHLFRTRDPEQLICQICDTLVPTRFDSFIEHVEGMKHTTKYESFLLTNDIKEFVDSEKETIKKYHCFTCCVDLLHSQLIPHVITARHKCNLANSPSSSGDIEEISQSDLQKVWKLHKTYFMEYNGTELYCKLCDSEIQSRDIGKHIQNSTHKAQVDAVLNENEMTKADDFIHCGVCKSCSHDNELEHIFSDNHKQNIQMFALPKTKRAKQNVTNSRGYFCGICNVEILGSENIIQLHNAGKRHQSNIMKLSTSAARSPINKPAHNDQPLNKISIKHYVLCEICKTKYENKPDEKLKHEESNFHKYCQKFLRQSSKCDQPESSKGRNTSVYCFQNNEQDPFYLINKATDIQCQKELQTSDYSNNSSVFNFIPGVPLYYWCESDENDPFYLSAIATRAHNKTEQTSGCSSKMTIFNFIPDVPLYYSCEDYQNDPFYLLSAKSTKTSIETSLQDGREQQIAGCSNNKSVVNCIPEAPKSQHDYHISTQVPMYYWCESYDKDPFYLMSAILKNSKNQRIVHQDPPATDLQKKSNENICNIAHFQQKLLQAIEDQNLTTRSSKETKDSIHLTNCFNYTTKAVPTNTDEHLTKTKQVLNMVNSDHSSRDKNTTAAPTQLTPQTIAESTCIVNDYCSVCSTKVAPANVREHLRGARHRENVAFLNEAKSVVVNEYCTICKVKVPTGSVENYFQHVNGKYHKANVAVVKKNKTSANTSTGSQQLNPVVNGFCTVCKVAVPGGDENIRIHVNGNNHKENLAAAQKNKTSANTSTGSQQLNPVVNGFCTVCKVLVPGGDENIRIHVNGNNHKGNVAAAQKNKTSTNTSTGSQQLNPVVNGFCTVCKVAVPGGDENIRIHVNGNNHKENVAAAQKNKTNANTSAASQQLNLVVNGFCTVCKVLVPGGDENIRIHVNGNNHKGNVTAAAQKNKTNANTSSSSHKGNSVSIPTETRENKYRGVFSAIPRTTEQLCNICNVRVSNNIQCLDLHLAGVFHKEIAEIFYEIGTNERVCNICNVHMPNTIEDMSKHLKSQRHIDSLKPKNTAQTNNNPRDLNAASSNNGPMTYCNICNVKMFDGHTVSSHLSSKRHRTTFDNLTPKDKLNFVTCWAQQFAVPRGDTPNYIPKVSTSHDTTRTNSRESSASRNNIHASDVYTCQICNVEVPNKPNNIQEHMLGKNHKKKLIELNTASNKVSKNEASNSCEKAVENSSMEIKTSVYTNTQAITEPNIKNLTASNANNKSDNKKASNAASVVTTKTDIADSDDDDSDDGFYICKICNVLVENNQTDIQSHLRSYKHLDNVKKNKESAIEKSETVKTYFCQVCKCTTVDNPIAIKTHDESTSHCQRLYKILINNKIRVRGHIICYCELCDLYFNKVSALSHIAQEKHKKLIAEAGGTSDNPVDKGLSDSS